MLEMVVGEGFEPSKSMTAVYSLLPLAAREPHHGVMLFTACSLIGKRGASYQMTRRCKVYVEKNELVA